MRFLNTITKASTPILVPDVLLYKRTPSLVVEVLVEVTSPSPPPVAGVEGMEISLEQETMVLMLRWELRMRLCPRPTTFLLKGPKTVHV